jgi:hypothetical protein
MLTVRSSHLAKYSFPFLLLIVEDAGKHVQLDKPWRRVVSAAFFTEGAEVIDMKRLKLFAKRGVRAQFNNSDMKACCAFAYRAFRYIFLH